MRDPLTLATLLTAVLIVLVMTTTLLVSIITIFGLWQKSVASLILLGTMSLATGTTFAAYGALVSGASRGYIILFLLLILGSILAFGQARRMIDAEATKPAPVPAKQ